MSTVRSIASVSLASLSLFACDFSLQAGGRTTTPAQVSNPAAPIVVAQPAPVAPPDWRRLPRRRRVVIGNVATTPPVTGNGTPTTTPTSTPTTDTVPVVTHPTPFGGSQADADSLQGEVFFIPENTTHLPNFSTLSSSGILYTKQLNIPATGFQQGFPGVDNRFEWFAIRYEGPLTVVNPSIYDLRLVSDDGARVYIDNVQVIDNDGIHPPQEKLGRVDLVAGVHTLRVEYFQGPRDQIALQLFVKSATLAEQILTTRL